MSGRSGRGSKPGSISGPVVALVLLSEDGAELDVATVREATSLSKTQIYGVMCQLVEKGMVAVSDPGKAWIVRRADS